MRWANLQLVDAVADFPVERFLVDVGEENATREEAAIRIDIEEILGVENDRLALLLRGERHRNAAQQAAQTSSFSVRVRLSPMRAKERRSRKSVVRNGGGQLQLLRAAGQGELDLLFRACPRDGPR